MIQTKIHKLTNKYENEIVIKNMYEIDEIISHRCVPAKKYPNFKNSFALGVVYGRSGSGKSATLQSFQAKIQEGSKNGLVELFDNERDLINSLNLNLNLNLKSTNFKIMDEFGSKVDPDARYAYATQLQKSLKYDSGVMIAINDKQTLDYLQPDWVFNVDECEFDKNAVKQDKNTLKKKRMPIIKKCKIASAPKVDVFNVGLIVGKTGTVNNELLDQYRVLKPKKWNLDKSLLAQLPQDITLTTSLLNAVGLRSIMMWLTPYKFLSTGQKARANLIPYLMDSKSTSSTTPLLILGFGNTVDPMTQCSMAYSFGNSARKMNKHVIVQSNEERIQHFLKADWVVDTTKCKTWVPKTHSPLKMTIEVQQINSKEASRLWKMLKYYHYLSHTHGPIASFKI